MTTVWDRQNPRVSYQVPVGVLDPAQQRLLNMISINISRGGMFVDTPEELEVGKELVCNLPIGDYEAMQVRGRVAWQRPKSISDDRHPRGVGIEFIDLTVAERERLQQIIGDQEELSHGVRLQVEGMQGAINAQAQLTPHGIFFRSPLPFLQLNSQVDFAFDDDNGKESYQGRIVDVKVHRDPGSPVPRLQVEVELLTIGSDDHDIPSGLSSNAAYEVMHIDREDTERSAVDLAVDDAIDDTIHHAMHAIDRGEPAFVRNRGRESIELHFEEDADLERDDEPMPHEAMEEDDSLQSLANEEYEDEADDEDESEYEVSGPGESDPILLVMPKHKPDMRDGVVSESLMDSTDRLEQPVRKMRVWGAVALVAALMLAVVWTKGSSKSKPTGDVEVGSGSLLPVANASEAERVRSIIEGSNSGASSREDEGYEQAPANSDAPENLATGGPKTGAEPSLVVKERAAPPAAASPAAATPVVKPVVPKAPAAKPKKSAREQTLGGVLMREDANTLVVRIPIKGSLEDSRSYLLADPPGLAINLPYAQPSEGYHESLSPESDVLRLVWVRERLGGLHYRMFFDGAAPTCQTEFADTQVTVTCQR